MILERDKIYLDRAGNRWRVVCVDATESSDDHFSVIAYQLPAGEPQRFTLDGSYGVGAAEFNLISEYREPREFWIIKSDDSLAACYEEFPGRLKNSYYEKIHVREVLDDQA